MNERSGIAGSATTIRCDRGCTVSLVSRDLSLFCGGRTVAINTPLESAWSKKLISEGIVVNRVQLDELE